VTEEELEEIIEKARIDRAYRLNISGNQLTTLPESIGSLIHLTILDLDENRFTKLPDSICNLSKLNILNLDDNQLIELPKNIGNLSKLNTLYIRYNQLAILPDSIGDLTNLTVLYLNENNLTKIPTSIGSLHKLTTLDIEGNLLSNLGILNSLDKLRDVYFLGANLPRQYWMNFNEWNPQWLLYEDNVEIKRVLIQQVGYEKICRELNAVEIDSWREYTLLRIDVIERYYGSEEPMVLLKMTCPSTGHIHILRVPPEMTSAEAAITWVNHGIHPDEFSVQT
jgi:leucine-rich repeat protein SHOC2